MRLLLLQVAVEDVPEGHSKSRCCVVFLTAWSASSACLSVSSGSPVSP